MLKLREFDRVRRPVTALVIAKKDTLPRLWWSGDEGWVTRRHDAWVFGVDALSDPTILPSDGEWRQVILTADKGVK